MTPHDRAATITRLESLDTVHTDPMVTAIIGMLRRGEFPEDVLVGAVDAYSAQVRDLQRVAQRALETQPLGPIVVKAPPFDVPDGASIATHRTSGECPTCRNPDVPAYAEIGGTLDAHRARPGGGGWCSGAGLPPVPGSVRHEPRKAPR